MRSAVVKLPRSIHWRFYRGQQYALSSFGNAPLTSTALFTVRILLFCIFFFLLEFIAIFSPLESFLQFRYSSDFSSSRRFYPPSHLFILSFSLSFSPCLCVTCSGPSQLRPVHSLLAHQHLQFGFFFSFFPFSLPFSSFGPHFISIPFGPISFPFSFPLFSFSRFSLTLFSPLLPPFCHLRSPPPIVVILPSPLSSFLFFSVHFCRDLFHCHFRSHFPLLPSLPLVSPALLSDRAQKPEWGACFTLFFPFSPYFCR